MIPKKIHILFGLDSGFCSKPISEFHLMNLESIKYHNPSYEITIYYFYESVGKIWDIIKKEFVTVKLKSIPITIFGKTVKFKEHISDLIRLQLLKELGGIYLDIDVVSIKSFDELLNNNFVMGKELSNSGILGLCNAVILSEKNSEFCNVWIEDYRNNFISDSWNYNSVIRPLELYYNNYNLITVLEKNAFFKYCWDEIDKDKIFNQHSDISDCIVLHQWESRNYNILSLYNKEYIQHRDDTLSCIYKKCR